MLTPREQDVVNLITEGLPNKQIATKLKISVRTVETHRKRAFHKLSVHSGVELMRRNLDAIKTIDEHDLKIIIQCEFNKWTGERLENDVALGIAEAIRKHLGGQNG